MLSLWRLSSPPSGPVQRASDAASGQSVDAAPASGSETVNYSSKQRSHSVALAPTGMKFAEPSLTCSQNVRRDVCHQPLRANSPVHLVTSFQLPFPAECVGCSLCGSLRGGMRRVFFFLLQQRAKRCSQTGEKLGRTTARTVSTSLTSLSLFTLCRINMNINTGCALSWARGARPAAPRAALVRLRKKMDPLPP